MQAGRRGALGTSALFRIFLLMFSKLWMRGFGRKYQPLETIEILGQIPEAGFKAV